MNEILTSEFVGAIVTAVVVPLFGVLTTFVVTFIRLKTDELKNRIRNENINKYISIAEDAIATAVTAVSQTFVETIKKEGTFSQREKEEAFTLAKERAVAIMGPIARNILKEAYHDVDAWLDSKIEYYVNISKN